ncbi:hypothetical protein BJF89_15730 [Corynebacterium sp. CNJ-954]|nr:hypothetical protein BJF89_15730 [Corynebacterium sp. CNJ-954]
MLPEQKDIFSEALATDRLHLCDYPTFPLTPVSSRLDACQEDQRGCIAFSTLHNPRFALKWFPGVL